MQEKSSYGLHRLSSSVFIYFSWKEAYCSRSGQKWEFVVIGGSWVSFRVWKTMAVLTLYQNQAPQWICRRPKQLQLSDPTTYWSFHLLPCIQRVTHRTQHAPQHNGTNFWKKRLETKLIYSIRMKYPSLGSPQPFINMAFIWKCSSIKFFNNCF